MTRRRLTLMVLAIRLLGRFAAASALALLCEGAASSSPQQPAGIPVVRLEPAPGQAPALIPALPVTRLDDQSPAADIDRAPAVSLTFADPLPVRDVLLLLFRGTRFSVVFDPGVNGKFAGELSNLTLRHALEAVLFPVGLTYSVAGTVVRISPRRPETRLFDLGRTDVARSWRRTVRSGTAPDQSTVAAELSTVSEAAAFRELTDGIVALLSPGGRFHVDRKTGLVQVTDFADRLDLIGLYLEAVSVRSTRQVRLHARVIEVVLAQAPALDWAVVAAQAGVRAGSGAGIRVTDFDALLRAVASFGETRIVAAPQVLAMNNEPAVMRIGSHSAAFTISGSEAPATTASRALDASAAALTLTIVPQIGADGIVQMSVSPTFTGRPDARDRRGLIETDTMVRVQGGETVVFAGFIRDVEETVAASGLSAVFGAKDRRTRRRELIILLTPSVVTPGGAAANPQ